MSLGFNNTPPVRFEGPRPDVVSAPRFFWGGILTSHRGVGQTTRVFFNRRPYQQKTVSTKEWLMQVLRSTIVMVCAACVFVACGGGQPHG